MDKAKPFDIPKREVWEAFKRVKANQGAAGVDGQSIADFEADLSNNLYLHHRSDKSLQDLAAIYNSYIRGWINYYGQFYRKQLRPTLLRIDTYLVRWARWKFKRLRRRHWGAREWLARVRCANPTLFSHWRFLYVGSRTSEAV